MTWRRVDPYFARRVQRGIFVAGLAFGADYFATPMKSSSALTAIEASFIPLWLWGAAICAASLAGLVVEGLVLRDDDLVVRSPLRRRWGWVSTVAHVVLVALFVVLGGSALQSTIAVGMRTGDYYLWRTPVMWLGFAWLNWQYINVITDRLPRR